MINAFQNIETLGRGYIKIELINFIQISTAETTDFPNNNIISSPYPHPLSEIPVPVRIPLEVLYLISDQKLMMENEESFEEFITVYDLLRLDICLYETHSLHYASRNLPVVDRLELYRDIEERVLLLNNH